MKKLALFVYMLAVPLLADNGRDWFVGSGMAQRWDGATNWVEYITPHLASGNYVKAVPVITDVSGGSGGDGGILEYFQVLARHSITNFHDTDGLTITFNDTNVMGAVSDIIVFYHKTNSTYTVNTISEWDGLTLTVGTAFGTALHPGDSAWVMTNTLDTAWTPATNVLTTSGGLYAGNAKGPVMVRLSGATNTVSLSSVSGFYADPLRNAQTFYVLSTNVFNGGQFSNVTGTVNIKSGPRLTNITDYGEATLYGIDGRQYGNSNVITFDTTSRAGVLRFEQNDQSGEWIEWSQSTVPQWLVGDPGTGAFQFNNSTSTVMTLGQDMAVNIPGAANIATLTASSAATFEADVSIAGNAIADAFIERYTPIFQTTFSGSGLPTGMVENGGWTVTNALYSPDSPSAGWSNICVWNERSSLDDVDVTTEFVPMEANVVVGVCKTPGYGGQVGIIGLVDDAANQLMLLSTYDGTNTLTGLASNAIPALVVNRAYSLNFHKSDAGHAELSWTDTVSGSNVVVKCSGQVNGMDRPGVVALSGKAKFTRLTYSTRHPRRPKILIRGDSFTEGDTMGADRDYRWCAKVRDWLGGNVAITGMGGEVSGGLLTKTNADLNYFRPDWVLVYIQNDSVLATFTANLTNILTQNSAIGAKSIVATLGPWTNATQQTFFNDANAWIRTNASVWNYRIVDFALAYSTNGTGTDFNWDYTSGDGVHPNAAGHAALFERMKVDLPDIMGSDALTRKSGYASDRSILNLGAKSTNTLGTVVVEPNTGLPAMLIGRATGQPSIKGSDSYLMIDAAENGIVSINHYATAAKTYLAQNGSQVSIGQTAGGATLAGLNIYSPSDRVGLWQALDIAGNVAMIQLTNGPVGIGTNSPQAALHVTGNGAVNNLLRLGTTAVDSQVVVTTNMTVGIGTNAPTSELHVHGVIMAMALTGGAYVTPPSTTGTNWGFLVPSNNTLFWVWHDGAVTNTTKVAGP